MSSHPKDPMVKSRDPSVLDLSFGGPRDPHNPKNWPIRMKITSTGIVSLFTFICAFASAVVAPALPAMAEDLHVDGNLERKMMLSVFVLGYLCGPIVFGPLSEVFGRVAVLNTGNLTFLAFNLACGFARTFPQMIVLRFFAGFGGIASLSCGSGLLSDCWTPEQRARVWAFFVLMPLIGPSLGPLIGAFIVENVTWRWIFWATSLFDGLVLIASLVFLKESYAPVILSRRVKRSHEKPDRIGLRSKVAQSLSDLLPRLSNALRRPIVMLSTEPVLQAMTVYGAFLYGLMYLVLATFTDVWTERYHEKTSIAGLNYLSLTVGFAVGEFGTAAAQDIYYRSRTARTPRKKGRPEFRLPVLIPEAILLPIGLFWYGWSIQAKTRWIMPDVGVAIIAASIMGSSQLVALYVVDSFETHTASAVSGLLILRFMAGFAFPLFAPELYASMGWGWGNSVMAFVAIGIGVSASTLLLLYGERLRKAKWGSKSKAAQNDN